MPTPALVQSSSSGMNQNLQADVWGLLPQPSLAGNTLVLFVMTNGSRTLTVSDDVDGSTGWSQIDTKLSSQAVYCWVKPSGSSGVRKVTVSFSSTVDFFQMCIQEYCGIAATSPVDTHNTNNATSTTATVNLTMTQDDLVIQYAIQESVSGDFNSAGNASFTADYRSTLVHADVCDGTASQYGRAPNGGFTTATLTLAPSSAWVSVAVALKVDTAQGTAYPTTKLWIRRRQFGSILLAAAATSRKTQIPVDPGSLLVMSIHSWDSNTNNHSVSSVLDQGNNNFFSGAASSFTGSTRFDFAVWYSPNASDLTPFETISFTTSVSEITVAAYEVVNAVESAPLGATFTNTGNQADMAANHGLSMGTFTPQRGASMVIGLCPIDVGTAQGAIDPDTTFFDGFSSTAMDGGFNRLEQDNWHGWYLTPTAVAAAFAMTATFPNRPAGVGNGVGNWGISSAEFFAARITTQPVSQHVTSGQPATFTVTAQTSGGTLHYQWKQNGSNVGTDSTSYTTAATVNTDNNATVQCVVSDDNGSTNSTMVYLFVDPTGLDWLWTA